MMARPCVICERMSGDPENRPSGWAYNCQHCGIFTLGDRAQALAETKLPLDPRLRAITSYTIRKMQRGGQTPRLDDKEVELRTAKFVVAELTYGNRGAYWEAGFAHGLGKPVFYLCDGARFRRGATHFDTNHHFTILWDTSNMAKAGDELKTAIRFALPGDAKLTDD